MLPLSIDRARDRPSDADVGLEKEVLEVEIRSGILKVELRRTCGLRGEKAGGDGGSAVEAAGRVGEPPEARDSEEREGDGMVAEVVEDLRARMAGCWLGVRH